MSGSSTPTAASQPKQMSSRLMNMKFMQRADAAGPSSRTPASAPPSKRRRVDYDSQASSPVPNSKGPLGPSATPSSTPAQSQSQSRLGKDGDETEWVLNIAPPQSKTKPQSNGYNQREDGDEEDEDSLWSSQSAGRQIFGSFNRKKDQTQASGPATNDDELSSVSDSDGEPKSSNSTRTPTQPRGANSNNSPRSSQQPKRFFEQISITDPTDPRSPAPDQRRKKSKQNKKPRITI